MLQVCNTGCSIADPYGQTMVATEPDNCGKHRPFVYLNPRWSMAVAVQQNLALRFAACMLSPWQLRPSSRDVTPWRICHHLGHLTQPAAELIIAGSRCAAKGRKFWAPRRCTKSESKASPADYIPRIVTKATAKWWLKAEDNSSLVMIGIVRMIRIHEW